MRWVASDYRMELQKERETWQNDQRKHIKINNVRWQGLMKKDIVSNIQQNKHNSKFDYIPSITWLEITVREYMSHILLVITSCKYFFVRNYCHRRPVQIVVQFSQLKLKVEIYLGLPYVQCKIEEYPQKPLFARVSEWMDG